MLVPVVITIFSIMVFFWVLSPCTSDSVQSLWHVWSCLGISLGPALQFVELLSAGNNEDYDIIAK